MALTSIIQYVESLTSPIRVCVIDSDEEVGYQIEDALVVYNCSVQLSYDSSVGCRCLQTGNPCNADLVFISDTVPNCLDIIRHIEKSQPEASIVVLTRAPSSPVVEAIMRHGVYTFLTKNGSFTPNHVKNIFQQLNLRLHASDPAGTGDVAKPETQPV